VTSECRSAVLLLSLLVDLGGAPPAWPSASNQNPLAAVDCRSRQAKGTAVEGTSAGHIPVRDGEMTALELLQDPRMVPLLVPALEILKHLYGENSPQYANGLNNLAKLYTKMGRYSKAEPFHQQAREILRKAVGEHHPNYALILLDLAELYRQMGQYTRAEPLYRQAVEILEKVPNHPFYAGSLHSVAGLYKELGQYSEAERLLVLALKLTKQNTGKDKLDYATSLGSLGLLYLEVGEYAGAERRLVWSMQILRQVVPRANPDYAQSLDNLAQFYHDMGRYDKAKPLYRQACEIFQEALGKDHPFYARSLNNLGALYRDMGQYAKAERFYLQASEIVKDALGRDHPYYALSLSNLAVIYSHMGQYDKAEPLHLEAMEIVKKAWGEGHPSYAYRLNNLATLYYLTGRYAQTEPLYLQAVAITRKALGEEHPALAIWLNNLAVTYQSSNSHKQALLTQQRALEVEQINLGRVFGFSSEPDMRAYLSTVANSLRYLVSMAMAQKETYPEVTEVAFAWVLRRKAIVLDTLCRFREAQALLAREPDVAQRVARWRGVRQRLSNLAVNPSPAMDTPTLQQNMTRLREQRDRLEADMNRVFSQKHPLRRADYISPDAVRKRLPPGTALVEFLRTEPFDFRAKGRTPRWQPPRYFAFVLTADRKLPVSMVDIGEAKQVDEEIQRSRAPIEGDRNDTLQTPKEREADFRRASAKLYHLVFAPLKRALRGAKLVYLAPDGELNRIPFEALVDASGMYLIETYRFAYLSSGKDLLQAPGRPRRGTVVFADPDYNLDASRRQKTAKIRVARLHAVNGPVQRGRRSQDLGSKPWERLPDARVEAADVRSMLRGTVYGPVRVYRDKAALEEVFKAVRSPRILHVASHGFFAPDQRTSLGGRSLQSSSVGSFGLADVLRRLGATENPLLRSGLVLAGANRKPAGNVDDGWVTAEEISQMDLHGTELVVLSACDSGLGDLKYGEGVYGLRRAFLYAGARTLVTTLFPVRDRETRWLMHRMYQRLKAKQGKLEALRAAQLEMICKLRTRLGAAPPSLWASFILVGDPR
jgi:CHAT domain-containing protein/tetratricopeptide (TPR) repeat protein